MHIIHGRHYKRGGHTKKKQKDALGRTEIDFPAALGSEHTIVMVPRGLELVS